jgi:enamine deaminase RidA (YjgF/YER057c/UK114 family)
MTRRLISSGSKFEAEIGYSRAVVHGDTVYVSGTTGYDYATMTLASGVVAQCRQVLKNIEVALADAGATLDDVVRVTYVLPNPEDFEPCWPELRRAFGVSRPAATMFSARLINPDILIEIEVTARLRSKQ